MLLAVVVLEVAAFHGVRHDDAYITFRYGQNLALGRGLVFNPGERVLGTTAPGHAVLGAAASLFLGRDAVLSVMSGLGCLAWAAQAMLIFLLLAPALGRREALAVAALVAAGLASSFEWVALETNIVVALTLGALCLARRGRWVAAAAVCALAGFVRPDAHLVSLLLAVVCLVRLRRRAWVPALVFVVPTLVWAAFSVGYYGSLLPQTAVAKLHRAETGAFAGHIFSALAASFPAATSLPAAVLLWALAAAGGILLTRMDRWLGILPAYCVVHLGAYLYMSPKADNPWHLYPAVLLFCVLAMAAVAAAPRLAGDSRLVRAAAAVVLGALLALVAGRTLEFALSHAHSYWYGSRDAAYRVISDYLRRKAAPTDVVASIEVGTFAYYTDLRMYDWSSLITRDGIRYPPRFAPYQWVVLYKDYLHLSPGVRPCFVVRSDDFVAFAFDLRPAQVIEEPASGGK